MPVLLQVCAVIVTLAIAGIAIATITAMRRFEQTAEEFRKTARVVRATVAEAEGVTRQVEELIGSFESVVPPLRRAAERLEDVSHRATNLSSALLNEVEGPIRNTLALVTGVRSGTRSLVQALSRRMHSTQLNGGQTP